MWDFNVTLTVTNDRGASASMKQVVTVDVSSAPTGDWVFSPTSPVVNGVVVFNGNGVKAAPGRTIVQYNWDFGDTTTGSGAVVTHAFGNAATYNVLLTVVDDAGQQITIPHQVQVGTANPTAKLTLIKTGGNSISADGSQSTAVGSAVIQTYTFAWNDGSVNTSGPGATSAPPRGPARSR